MARIMKSKLQRKLLPAIKSERAANKLVKDWMKKSGLDIKALAALQEGQRLEFQKFVEEERARAVKLAATTHAAVKDQARALQKLAKTSAFFTIPSFTLDKPVRISANFPEIQITSRIKPFDSFAKIRVDRRKNAIDKVAFIFEWRNSSTASVAIDAVTFFVGSGFIELFVSGGVTYHYGFVDVHAQIALGPTSGKSITHEIKSLGPGLSTQNVPFLPGDGHASRAFSNAFNLTALHHPVGPLQTVVIEVSMAIESVGTEPFKSTTKFQTKADFESGSFGVSCPLVVVRVHQVPPEILPD